MQSQNAKHVVAPVTSKLADPRVGGRSAPKPLDPSQLKQVSGGAQSETTAAPHKGW